MSTSTSRPTARPGSDRGEAVHLEGAPESVRAVREDGVVVLHGDLRELSACGRTRDCVLRTLAGTAVADETVVPGARPAQHPERSVPVARAVQAAIDRTHADATVLVACDGGVATLMGRAGNAADRGIAGRAAWSVPGVHLVQNWIRTDG